MDPEKEAKKYLNKYFKAQHLKKTDDEYKALVRLLKQALRMHAVSSLVCPKCKSDAIAEYPDYKECRICSNVW